MEAVLIAIFVGSAVIAFLVGRLWAASVPLVALGVLYAGLIAGWWGHGVGDNWQFAMAFVMGVGVLAAVLGLAARALLRQRVEGRAPSRAPR